MQTQATSIQVPLVDNNGTIIGYSEKMHVHRRGLLHLAFSLMITRQGEDGAEFLLQRRASHKYHSGGLWTNTCCSHPLMHESIADAAKRRVSDELGITTSLDIRNVAKIQYNHQLENGLFENEFNHLLLAHVDEIEWNGNPDEVMDIRWWSGKDIQAALLSSPEHFTAWFSEVFAHVYHQDFNALS